jgi:hypothetical protein
VGPLVGAMLGAVVSTVFRFVEQTWTSAVRAALIQSSFPSVPATFQEVIGSGHVLERMWSGTSPPLDQQLAVPPCVSFRTGLACFIGVSLHRLLPSGLSAGKSECAAFPHCHSGSFRRWFLPWLPMPFTIKRAVDIHRCVPVGIDFKMTHRASEQLAPFDLDAFAALVGEPLPFRAASGAILAGAMWIHLESYCALNIGLVFGVAVDLAAQLIGLAAVHPPRFACAFGLDLPQPLKEQHTAGILGADVGNDARDGCRAASSFIRRTCSQIC